MEAPPPGQLTRRVVWVQRLTAAGLLRLWAESALRGAEVRFDPFDATPRARALHAWLKPSGLTPTVFVMARRGADGESLTYRREEEIDAACRALGEKSLPDAPGSLRRALSCFLSVQLLERKTFLAMTREAAREDAGAAHEFLIARHPAAEALGDPDPTAVRQDLSPDAFLRSLARPVLLFLRACAASLIRPGVRGDARPDRDAVWLEYYPDDLGGYISRAFWKDGVDTAKYDRVIYVDARDTPCDDATVRRIKDYGFRWIDARRPWSLGPAPLSGLLATFTVPFRSEGPLWLRLFLWEHALWTEIWTAAFKRHRVRLLFQYQDFSWIQDAQARALDRAGGAMVGLHWAEAPFLVEPEHLTPFPVYFAWGTNQSRRLAAKGHDCREILPCGAWILPDDGEVDRIRESLGARDFALAVFDTSVSRRAFVSPEQISEFMLASLRLVASRPRWKIALKPKGDDAYRRLPAAREIESLIACLAKEGRALVLDPKVSPVSVGLACDLSFGVGVNSAAVLVGAFGGRCVHWDAPGWSHHPLVAEGAGTVVFEGLEDALLAIAAAAGGDARIGDFTRWAPLVNHFSDRAAHGRVAGWVADVLAATGAGRSIDEAVASASDAYRLRHGVSADFAERGGWWRPAQQTNR